MRRFATAVVAATLVLTSGCASMQSMKMPTQIGGVPLNWKTCGGAGAVVGGLLAGFLHRALFEPKGSVPPAPKEARVK